MCRKTAGRSNYEGTSKLYRIDAGDSNTVTIGEAVAGGTVIINNGTGSPELLRREMETLEHFRLVRYEGYDEYSYYPVDLDVFWCEISPIILFKPDWNRRRE